MSNNTLNTVSTSLDKLSIKEIQVSFLATLPIYRKLALDIISDEETPDQYIFWVGLLDIYAIQTSRHGYFDCGNVLQEFEKEIKDKLVSFKTHKEIKEFILKLYSFEMERTAKIKSYIQENSYTELEC